MVAIVLLVFAGLGIVLLLWPSKFLRHIQNPLEPDTPVNRVYARALGLFVCLFVLMIISGSMKNLEGFHRNMGFASHPAHIPKDSLAIFGSPKG
jgi:hypothetical protein